MSPIPQDPYFTIVIPCYNRGHMIMATLESVFRQTFHSFEIIVVDNCSTDNSAEILQKLDDEGKIRFIPHDQNYERARSRNTGMQNAKGNYLTLLDSDDFMYKDALQDAYDFTMKNPDTKVFQNEYELVNEQMEVIYTYPFPSLKNQYKALASGNFMACVGGFLHREVYQSIQFDTNRALTGSEDYEYWFRVLSKYQVGRISKVNNGVLFHDGRSINSDTFTKIIDHMNYIVKTIETNPEVYEKFGKYIPRFKSSFYIYGAIMANNARAYSKAIGLLTKAFKTTFSVIFTRRFIRVLQIALFRIQVQ